MLSKSKDGANYNRDSSSIQQMTRSSVATSRAPETSFISSGLSIIGKIVGHGSLTIFGQVEGELCASTVAIAEGAQMEGDVVAEAATLRAPSMRNIGKTAPFAKRSKGEQKILNQQENAVSGQIGR